MDVPFAGIVAPTPAIPKLFDERYYAIRTGMGSWVTSPSPGVVHDLVFVRLGMRNRWQTKRGPADDERIVDWVTIDMTSRCSPRRSRTSASSPACWTTTPVADRRPAGPLSSGIFDFFENGQRLVTLGAFLDRPPKGGFYAGVHILDGPVSSTILTSSYTYRMSPKWVFAYGASMDIHDSHNVGQMLTMTRVGESFLVSAGFNFNASQGNWGAGISIEPRFLPKTRLGQAGGAIPVAGAYGIE